MVPRQEEDFEGRARDCIARFGVLAMFRIEDEINQAVVQRLTAELRQWLRVRSCALALLSGKPGCLTSADPPFVTAH